MKDERTVAILQSNYIPWKGYFDIIRKADIFILYDDVQYTRRDWRNRNRIKTDQGPMWLTIPVSTKGKYDQLIKDTKVEGHKWTEKHMKSIMHAYSKAPYYEEYKDLIHDMYTTCHSDWLSEINLHFLIKICSILGISTQIYDSSNYTLRDGKSERLLGICSELDATKYISGPAAKSYLNVDLFSQHGISVEWMDYTSYREYPQLYPPFMHDVTIIDVILHTGGSALDYIITKNSK